MGTLLRGGDFYKPEKSIDSRGPIAGLMTNMFKITDVQVNSIGESALDIYLESNAGHEDHFLDLCLDLVRSVAYGAWLMRYRGAITL
jgi:hypothetical protein